MKEYRRELVETEKSKAIKAKREELQPKTENIDEVKRKNEELQLEIEELKKQIDVKNELFRIVAHDLRGPIGNLSTIADIILENVKNIKNTEDFHMKKEGLIDVINMLSDSSQATYKLLQDLLTWSRLQQGGINPEILVMKLSDQVREAIAPLLQTANNKDIKLGYEISDNINILADRMMLQTVIRNLSSNAIKFSNKGGDILISCEKKNNNIKIYIKDNGIGLTEDKLKGLFESIGKSNKGTEGEEGTGLGLSICREMIEKMGGSISVESEGEGKGTTFIVTLPAEGNNIESR